MASALAGISPANAATTQCGSKCIDVFNELSGPSQRPNLVLSTVGDTADSDTQLILCHASRIYASEDFSFYCQDPVYIYYMRGLVSRAVYSHYQNDGAFQLEYTPDGVATGECVGFGVPDNDTALSFGSCNIADPGMTIWIVDSSKAITDSYVPLIAGNDANFSEPCVLTCRASTDQLVTANLAASSAAQLSSGQLWRADTGVLPT